MVTKKVSIALTDDRLAALNAVWQRLPHMRGSVAATLDYVLNFYIDSKGSSPAAHPIEAQQSAPKAVKEPVEKVEPAQTMSNITPDNDDDYDDVSDI